MGILSHNCLFCQASLGYMLCPCWRGSGAPLCVCVLRVCALTRAMGCAASSPVPVIQQHQPPQPAVPQKAAEPNKSNEHAAFVPLLPGSIVRLRGSNFPDKNLRHTDFKFKLGEPMDPSYDPDSTFHVIPGRSGSFGSVSLKSANFGDRVVRQCKGLLELAPLPPPDHAESIASDSSWYVRPALNGRADCISLESVRLPLHFVWHEKFKVKIKKGNGTASFNDDASWIVDVLQDRAKPAVPSFGPSREECIQKFTEVAKFHGYDLKDANFNDADAESVIDRILLTRRIFVTGPDRCVWAQPLCDMHPGSSWTKVSKEGVITIAIENGAIYGVGMDKCVWRQKLDTMTTSSDWEKVSKGDVLVIAIHQGVIYGVGPDMCVWRQPLNSMNTSSEWEKASSGGVVSIACGEGFIYAVCTDKMVWRHGLDTLNASSNNWEKVAKKGVSTIAIDKGFLLGVNKNRRVCRQPLDVMSSVSDWEKVSSADVVSIATQLDPLHVHSGVKLLEFHVKANTPNREFSAEISVQDRVRGAFIATTGRLVQQQALLKTWVSFSVYVAKVVFVHHEDDEEAEDNNVNLPHKVSGAEDYIHLDPEKGVRLLGENVLPNAVLIEDAPEKINPKYLREEGRMTQGTCEMRASMFSGKGNAHLLEFKAHARISGKLFSAYLMLEDEHGQTLCKVVLLDQIALSSEPEEFCFDVPQITFTHHHKAEKKSSDDVICIDVEKGVSFLGENILPSATLIGNNWSSENPRWSWIREKGWMCWEGKYEMRTSRCAHDDIGNLSIEMPSYWKVEDGHMASRRIQETSATCQAIQSLMDSTWKSTVTRDRAKEEDEGRYDCSVKQFEVVQVLRNENPGLWAAYWRQRERIRKRCEGKNLPTETAKTSLCDAFSKTDGCLSLVQDVREFYLFHGTKPSAAHQICSSDFRVDMAGSHKGTLYGKGLYFAESSSKSDEYASDDKEGLYTGLFCMLLCRVTCGDWLYNDEARPDVGALLQDVRQGRHDSVLGDREKARGTYREFIVFNSDQVYPEYIIIYKRKEETSAL